VPRSKNAWNYTSTLPIRLHGVVLSLKGTQGQLYLYILYTHTHTHTYIERESERGESMCRSKQRFISV